MMQTKMTLLPAPASVTADVGGDDDDDDDIWTC